MLVFARAADDGLASFAKRLDEIVTKNQKKNACGTVIVLEDDKKKVQEKLESIAKEQKLENVPLTVAAQGAKGPPAYGINKNVAFTVVVYDDEKKVIKSFAFEKLDEKSQHEALVAFCKVLGVDPPKADAKDEKKDDEKKEKKDSD